MMTDKDMTDIVEVLRTRCRCNLDTSPCSSEDLCKEDLDAAAEIERLRDEVATYRARVNAYDDQVARLRAALEEAAEFPCTCDKAFYERGRPAPDCLADLVSDDARIALGREPVCKGRAAIRARYAKTEKDTRDE